MSRAGEWGNGWRELLGAMIGLGSGIAAYSPVSSLFFRALEHEFGWSKTAGAIAFLALPITAFVLPFVGLLLDRFGVRRIAACSSILLAACLFLLSRMAGTLGVFYAIFICFNIFGSATGPISYTRAVAARFHRARGVALAGALLGIATAGVLLPIILGPMLVSGQWRKGYLLLASVALAGGLLALVLIRPTEKSAKSDRTTEGIALKKAVRTGQFWSLAIAIFCVSAGSIGFVSQFQSIMIESGIQVGTSLVLLSILSASVFISRMTVGWGLDHFQPEAVAAGAILLPAVGIVLWLAFPHHVLLAGLAVVLIGVSIGSEMDLMSFFCARDFGLRHFSAVYGGLAIFFYLGMGAGAVMYGMLHDRTGSYLPAILLSAGLFLASAILFLRLRSSEGAAVVQAH